MNVLKRRRIAVIHCDKPDQKIFVRNGRKNLEIWQLSEHAIQRVKPRNGITLHTQPHFPVKDNKDFPDLDDVHGVLIPGSVFNADEESLQNTTWMKRIMDFVRRAHHKQKPLLGMCFGHQMIAAAFGVPSVRFGDSVGAEVGFHSVTLTREGRSSFLFKGIGSELAGAFFHYYEVPELPVGAVRLASNSNCNIEAFRMGEAMWGVQFHPDYIRSDIELLAELKKNELKPVLNGRRIDLKQDTTDNCRVLGNFLEFVQTS